MIVGAGTAYREASDPDPIRPDGNSSSRFELVRTECEDFTYQLRHVGSTKTLPPHPDDRRSAGLFKRQNCVEVGIKSDDRSSLGPA